jgi:APA family basic amino acid/polyamine antiporter
VGPGRVVGNVLAVLKVTALLIFIGLGLTIGAGSAANLQQSSGSVGATAWLLALIPVMFTYSGWNAAAYMAEEIRDPGRNVPLALAVGTAAVIVIDLLLNGLYLYVMPVAELAGVRGSVLDVIADRLLGGRAGDIMGAVSIVSLSAGLSAWTFAGPRVYYAMARDGVFFKAVGQLHPRTRVPVIAIVLQGVWAAVVAITGKYEQILNYVVTIDVLFFGLTGASLLVFRARARREGTEEAAGELVRVPGHPFTTWIFVLACWSLALSTLISVPQNAGIGVLILGIGVLVYRFWAAPRPNR